MGRIVHFEIPTDNPEKALEFYQEIFGWKCQQWGQNDYWLTETGPADKPGINGAIMKRVDNRNTVVNTMEVDDLDKTLESISEKGGVTVNPPVEVPNIGRVAYFKDPDGNVMGIIQYNEPKI